MARSAENSLNGLTTALRTLHFHRFVRLHNNLLKKIAALKTSEFKNGHCATSVKSFKHYLAHGILIRGEAISANWR
jgi:hypothetical protein